MGYNPIASRGEEAVVEAVETEVEGEDVLVLTGHSSHRNSFHVGVGRPAMEIHAVAGWRRCAGAQPGSPPRQQPRADESLPVGAEFPVLLHRGAPAGAHDSC